MNSKVIFESVMRLMEEGEAFIPVETEGVGFQTKVFYCNGDDELLNCTTQRYLKILAEQYGIDLKILTSNFSTIIDKKQFIPLPLAPHLVLIPFLQLRTSNKNHIKGWVNLHRIISHHTNPKDNTQTILHLKSGKNSKVLNSSTHVQNQRLLADYVFLKYKQIHHIS